MSTKLLAIVCNCKRPRCPVCSKCSRCGCSCDRLDIQTKLGRTQGGAQPSNPLKLGKRNRILRPKANGNLTNGFDGQFDEVNVDMHVNVFVFPATC